MTNTPRFEGHRRQKSGGRVEPGREAVPVLEEGWRWKCAICAQDTFGIHRNGVVHIKYRERTMTIQGDARLEAQCRSCGSQSALNIQVYKHRLIKVNATDGASALANESDVDLFDVTGTGEDGRVLKLDVVAYMEARSAPDADPGRLKHTREVGKAGDSTATSATRTPPPMGPPDPDL